MRVTKSLFPHRPRRRGPPQSLELLNNRKARQPILEDVLQQVHAVHATDREELPRIVEPSGRELPLEP